MFCNKKSSAAALAATAIVIGRGFDSHFAEFSFTLCGTQERGVEFFHSKSRSVSKIWQKDRKRIHWVTSTHTKSMLLLFFVFYNNCYC